jgi:sugar-specific transcriptional regulator TrmB
MKNTLKQNLIELGITANEADVYLALLELGACSSGPLIDKTQLHRNVVYTSLSHLIKRKLIAEKTVRGVKHFSAVAPMTLKEEFEQKAFIASEVEKKIKASLPAKVQEITVHQGNEEYLQLLTGIIKSMPKGSIKYVIGTGGEEFMASTMRPIWKKYHTVAHAQRIHIKMLAYKDQRPALESDTKKEKIYEVRYLPEEIENPSGIHVYPEVGIVLNIIYSDKLTPVTAICIKNAALVQGYLNLFNNMWGMALE